MPQLCNIVRCKMACVLVSEPIRKARRTCSATENWCLSAAAHHECHLCAASFVCCMVVVEIEREDSEVATKLTARHVSPTKVNKTLSP